MAMGMMGMFVVHPRDPAFMPVDRDFLIMLNAFDIDPGTYVPRIMTMTGFQICGPGTAGSSQISIRWWSTRATGCGCASAT